MAQLFSLPRIGALALLIGTPAFADTATPAPTAAECEVQFKALDADINGTLTEAEAPQVYAHARVGNMTIAPSGYTKDEFLKACADNDYARPAPVAGAPFEGANSFTEGQAKDRATASGVSGISAMTKDDKGVWRGTGMVDTATVNVAVDFKGNVVTTAQ
jgi:hypothetical protein